MKQITTASVILSCHVTKIICCKDMEIIFFLHNSWARWLSDSLAYALK
jgi:hypothetical protein